MNTLQIGIIAGAIILAVIVAMILMGILPGLRTNESASASLLMWGFEDETAIRDIILKYAESHQNFDVLYVKKDINNFDRDLLNALASGGKNVPDIVVFPSDYLALHKNKLSAAPAVYFTEKDITQNYIDAASSFLGPRNEVLGVPFYADPLLLYWNTDLFTKNLLTLPPKTWDEFLTDSQKITQKDQSGNITVAGAALGRSVNIKNAPEILIALFLQSGEQIIGTDGAAILGNPIGGGADLRPAESSLRFMTDFSNTQKVSQGWSAALPEAKDMFIAGRLGMYLGMQGEFNEIKNKNPHLSFGVTLIPQLQSSASARPITSGTLFALTVPKISANRNSAWAFIQYLNSQTNSAAYADKTGGVSLRRDVLPAYEKESVRSAFAESALALKLWMNPNPQKTDQIFRDLIENAALGKGILRDLLDTARAQLENINK